MLVLTVPILLKLDTWGASLTGVMVRLKVSMPDVSTPPLAVPPLSCRRTLTTALPLALTAGV